jgi:tRNA U34 2-thiouridine synthase MnmA/TrmU
VVFKEPQAGVTPSQVAAFYINDTVLGSGLIRK